ncbi:hypothetical protein ABT262_51585, partial [Amycolatopsis mediterranei]
MENVTIVPRFACVAPPREAGDDHAPTFSPFPGISGFRLRSEPARKLRAVARPGIGQDGVVTDEVALAALGEVLSRRCWSTQQRDDAESAQRIIDEIARSDIDKTVLVALLGGVRAAFLPDELTDELAEAAATSARQLMPTRLADTERLAVAAALGVLADSG